MSQQQAIPLNVAAIGLHNVKYPVQNQEDGQGYLTSEPKEGSIGLVMLHEWWGLNKSTTITADTFEAASGYVVLAADLYRGKVGQSREEAGKYRAELDPAKAVEIIIGAVKYLKSKGCKKVGLVGFSIGSAFSIQACAASQEIDAAVPFYGVPDLSKCDVSKIKCPIMAHYGELDKAVGYSDITARENLEKAFKDGGVKNYEIKVWPKAEHAFMNQDALTYNAEAAKQALQEVIAWFKAKFDESSFFKW